jgi:hypothetical protein
MSHRYDLILACYLSGQMTEKQWHEHVKNEHFAAWVRKNG